MALLKACGLEIEITDDLIYYGPAEYTPLEAQAVCWDRAELRKSDPQLDYEFTRLNGELGQKIRGFMEKVQARVDAAQSRMENTTW